VNRKTLTRLFGAIAAALAVLLAVVLLQPPADTGTPVPSGGSQGTSTQPVSSGSAPTSQETAAAVESSPSQLPISEVDGDDTSPGATPYSQTGEARHLWEPVASGFGRAFTATKGKDAGTWRAGLTPYVTGGVRDQLATVTDLRQVPTGRCAGIEPAEYGDDKVAVLLHYDTGPTLVVYLILDGTGWRVYGYDRWEE